MNHIRFFVEGTLKKYRALFESVCPPPMSIPKGQRLCEQCSTRGWLYYILEGVAKVYLTTTDGNEHIVDFMKADTLIGMDCIDGGNRSVVSISGVTELRVLPFTPDMLRELILKNPELGFDLAVYYGEVLWQVAFMVGSMSHTDLLVRLATFLLLFVDPNSSGPYKVPLTQQDVASSIHVSRAQVAKMYAQLRAEGVLQPKNRHVLLCDAEKLQQYTQM